MGRQELVAQGGSSNIEALEQQLEREPDSKFVLEELLSAYATEELWRDPRHFEHVLSYVTRFPKGTLAQTPLARFHPEAAPDAWARVERAWLQHLRDHPTNAELARGYAWFLTDLDPQRALDVLREADRANPDDPELCTDMGRMCLEPAQRLSLFLRARKLGATQPNLLVWIARGAVDALDLEEAERAGHELLTLAAQARVGYGARLDWRERGRALWSRVRAEHADRAAARELVHAISDHAFRKHWGHTVLGVVAVHRGDIGRAVKHLEDSADVVGDPRLTSYGPSFRLARGCAGRTMGCHRRVPHRVPKLLDVTSARRLAFQSQGRART